MNYPLPRLTDDKRPPVTPPPPIPDFMRWAKQGGLGPWRTAVYSTIPAQKVSARVMAGIFHSANAETREHRPPWVSSASPSTLTPVQAFPEWGRDRKQLLGAGGEALQCAASLIHTVRLNRSAWHPIGAQSIPAALWLGSANCQLKTRASIHFLITSSGCRTAIRQETIVLIIKLWNKWDSKNQERNSQVIKLTPFNHA